MKQKTMENLKLHADGENDYLNSLKAKYENLKAKLMNNKDISEKEQIEKLSKITKDFEKEKNDLNQKLF